MEEQGDAVNLEAEDLGHGRPETGLAGFTEQQRKVALERFRVLRPAVEEGSPLTRAARDAGAPLRTAQRWMAAYKREGFAGLAPKGRSDRGRPRGLPEQLQRLIEGLALAKPKPSMAAVQRQAAGIANRYGWPEPTYRQVRGIVGRMEKGMLKLAHEGAKSYEEAFDLVHRTEATRPNEVWQADHTLLDVRLRDGKGKARRPWLTVILDDHSRAVAGYHLSFDAPSAAGTALALRRALRRKGEPGWPVCGVPESFYTDHGSDFTSRRMEQVAADLGMRLVFSTPGKPRGRGKVERFFGTVNVMLLSGMPGYVEGGTPRRGEEAEPGLTLPELDRAFRSWLLTVYLPRPHGQTGVAPSKRWAAEGFFPEVPEPPERLDLLLSTEAKTRRVRRDGIHFHALRYLDVVLAAYVGEDVVIRYDPRDLAEIRVHHEGRFLCRAVCPELSGEEVGLKEIRDARNRRRRELRRRIQDRRAVADELVALRRGEPAEIPGGAPEETTCEAWPPEGAEEAPLKLYEDD
jgi:putative transposase